MSDFENDQLTLENGQLRKELDKIKRERDELSALSVHQLHFADTEIEKFGSRMMGSSVIVTIEALGGKRKVGPFAIRDGLSDETIAALRRDMVRSYINATEFRPKGVTEYIAEQVKDEDSN